MVWDVDIFDAKAALDQLTERWVARGLVEEKDVRDWPTAARWTEILEMLRTYRRRSSFAANVASDFCGKHAEALGMSVAVKLWPLRVPRESP